VFLRSNEAASIIDKVATQYGMGRAARLISRPDPFGVGAGFNSFRPGPGEWAIDIQTPGAVKRTSADNVTRHDAWIKAPKVFIRSAVERGGTVPAQVFTVKAHPTHLPTICTAEHLMAGPCKTREEAENLASYLETRFVRFLVSLRRSAERLSPDDFKFVPLPDLSEPWTDEKLYAKYGLTEMEILCIEAQMKDKQ
jgi:site-specific DNA-methyltransferase (adenine-specific)